MTKDFGQTEDLDFSSHENGITVRDKNRTGKPVAHISEEGNTLTLYSHRLSYLAFVEIESRIIKNIRKSHRKAPKWNYGSFPVIVQNKYENNKSTYGVQYWTPEMIDTGKAENPDKTVSHYVALLQKITYGNGTMKVELKDWKNAFGDRFVVDMEVQPDYFRNFTRALDHFQRLQ